MTMMTPPPPLDEDEEMLVPNSDYTDGIDSMEPAQSETVSTVENQPTEEPPLFKFTWPIEHVSRLNVKKRYSDVFIVGGYKWRVLIFPKGNNVDHLSIYLDVADSATLPSGWSRYAFCSLAIVNQIHHKFTVKKELEQEFNAWKRAWGFPSFMPLLDLYDPTKGYLRDDTLIVEAEVRWVPDDWAYVSKKRTGFVGLKNQGATCYMNSLLQTLYHIPYFRKAVYHMPTTENDIPSKSIPLALQSLFYKVQYSDTSVSTKDLTRSLGWDTNDSFMQHDVQELNRVLCKKLEDKMKGTAVEDTIKHVFQGHYMNYIGCINVDYISTRNESFYDLQLDVKGCRDVYASFDKYVEVEQLDGVNSYRAGQYGLQDARKGVLFLDFPPVLQLQLKRFEYNFKRDTAVKIDDRYEFPLQLDLDRDNGKYLSPDADRSVRNLYTLHSVLVHSGGVHGGHYYASIRPTLSDQWYKFDDKCVTKEEVKRAPELPQPNPGLINIPNFFAKYSNAYMLVYIRESDKDKIICNVDEKDIAEHLQVRLKKEQEEKEKKWKEKREAHLYTIIKVARDEDLADQIGKDIYFDLVDHDKVRSFRVQEQQPFTSFKEEVAKEFGIPVQYLRFWLWAKRENHTYRPHRPLSLLEESQSVGHLREVSSKVQSPELKLFMEVKHGLDLCFLPPPEKKKDDILLFFKLYDPEKESLRYVGRSFEKSGVKPADILLKLNEMAGFPPDTEIELYEEIKFELCVMCERIDKRVPFRNSQIEDGAIICFQTVLSTDEVERYRYPYVRLFLEYVRNRQGDEEMLVPNSNSTDGIDTIEPEVSAGRVPDYWAYDSKKQKGFFGLKNQGAIYYMNPLLQTLYHIPYFRKAVYHMPTTENDRPSKSIPLALQSLFYKVQYSETSVSTEDLTKSFEWDTYDSFMQHDVQALKLVLFNNLKEKMKGTAFKDTINHLFEGHHAKFDRFTNVYKPGRPMPKSFYDLQLDVRGCRDVYASFDKYLGIEQLDDDAYDIPYELLDVPYRFPFNRFRFIDFPPVLQLKLKRFEYDFMRDTMVKINDRYEFPLQLDLDRGNGKYLFGWARKRVRNLYTLHSVLVHSGGVHGGHYYAFIRPTLSDQWYKFDDECVTKEEARRALEDQYGGEEELPQPYPGLINSPGSINTPSNAYMLVYIRESAKNKIMCNVDEKDIVEPLRRRDAYGAWEQYFGLEHADNTSKRIHQVSQNRH